MMPGQFWSRQELAVRLVPFGTDSDHDAVDPFVGDQGFDRMLGGAEVAFDFLRFP